jgi:hypothetical protein
LEALVDYEAAFKGRFDDPNEAVAVSIVVEAYSTIDPRISSALDPRDDALNKLGQIYQRAMTYVAGLRAIRESKMPSSFGTYDTHRLDSLIFQWDQKLADLRGAAERCSVAPEASDASCELERWVSIADVPYLPSMAQEKDINSRSEQHVLIGSTSATQTFVIDGEGGYYQRNGSRPANWDTGVFEFRTIGGGNVSSRLQRGAEVPPNTSVYYWHGDTIPVDNGNFETFKVRLVDPVFPDEYGINPSNLKRPTRTAQ